MTRASVRILCLAAATLASAPIQAQTTPGVVSGLVRDSAGRPIENALVALDPTTGRRVTRSDAAGRFRFDRVSRGRHELTTAWIGFVTDIREIEVSAEGLEVEIVLRVNIAALDTMRVVARRTGIHGTVIEAASFTPLAQAEVQVIGTNHQARTGADGRFDFPQVRHGAYVVHAKRSGYASRILSVTAPKDSAVELALTMERSTASERGLQTLLNEFDRRRRWMGGPNSLLVPRQELAGHQGASLEDALRYSLSYLIKGLRVDDSTCVYVNGVFQHTRTVKDFGAADVEAVEVYGTSADFTNTVTDRPGFPASRKQMGGICGEAQFMAGVDPGGRRRRNPSSPNRVEAIVIWTRR